MKTRILCIAGALALMTALPATAQSQVQSVPAVDLKLYTGTWYEIAAFPAVFQNEDCAGTTATYSLNPDGTIKVWNQCYLPDFNGYRLERIEGRARVEEPVSNARLKVSFFGGFEGDYWILALDDAYQYALVGTPNRGYLWILGREPVMSASTYQMLVEAARRQGFDVARLRQTRSRQQALSPQTAGEAAAVN